MIHMHIFLFYLGCIHLGVELLYQRVCVFLSLINISNFPNNFNPIKFNYFIFNAIISTSYNLFY